MIVTAYLHRRGTVELGERMGDPIRRRKQRLSPAARLVGVAVEYGDKGKLRDIVTCISRHPRDAWAIVAADIPRGLIPPGTRPTDVTVE